MWSEALKIAIGNGIFAVLFVILLMYQLKDSANREKKYQATIDKLSYHLGLVQDIKQDVEDIKQAVFKKGED